MDELAGHKPVIPGGICYEQKHPCIGGCWCCLGGDFNCYSTQDECKKSCTETWVSAVHYIIMSAIMIKNCEKNW